MTPDRLKMADKIRKLFALATSPNEHEAKLAAQRASELMEKYQIEMADVLLTEAKTQQVETERYEVPDQKMKLIWIGILAHGCAKLFDGEVLDCGGLHGTRLTFIGYPDDIASIKWLFEHLYKSWFGIVDSDLREAKSIQHFAPRDTMKFKAGHGLRYATIIRQRCVELVRMRTAHVQNTCTALIPLKNQMVQSKMRDMGVTQKSRHVSAGSALGQKYGERAGRNAAIGGAIQGNSQRLLK